MGLHAESGAIFVLVFSSELFLPLYTSICEEDSRGTTDTAVQFTFTNAGVAQTQNKGQLNTAPN